MTDIIEKAARWLDDGHLNNARFESFPADLMPTDIEGAYAIQTAFVRRLNARGWPSFGWKIALTAETMQQMVGVDRPLCATITAPQLHQSPADLKADDHGRICFECEVAVRLNRDLTPAAGPYDDAAIAASVGAVAAAFEVADDRAADYEKLEAFTLLADNGWNGGMVLGPVHETFDGPALADATAVLEIDGREVGRGVGSDALGHPFNSLKFLANEMTGLGHTLRAGDWVLTGTVIRTQFPEPGSELVYRHSLLGEVRAAVA